jgi:hypothetical protein
MKTSELKQSKYMKKEDCGDDGILVTIAGLKQENVAPDNKPEELKWILYFNGDAKPLVLNGTNTKLIEKALGSDETDDWLGREIVLFNDENVEYMGEVVGGVRCDVTRTKRYHAKKNAAQEKAPAVPVAKGAKATAEDFADDIPF